MEFDASLLILAGGQSRRMGFDKQDLVIQEDVLVERQIRQLGAYFKETIVVTKEPQRYAQLPVRTCQDIYTGQGPLAGIHSGLTASQYGHVFVIACDMPEWNLDYMTVQFDYLMEGRYMIVASQDNDEQIYPFHAFYHKKLVPILDKYLQEGRRKVQTFVKEQDSLLLQEADYSGAIDFDQLFVNLNRPEDVTQYITEQKGRSVSYDTFNCD